MNRIQKLFQEKNNNVLSVYFTAGYPGVDDTMPILKALEESGADMVELGMPFSDPLADGPTIQKSSEKALANGMSLNKLFEQIANMRQQISMPIVLMGYLNPVMKYGLNAFAEKCKEVGVDGLILPDLPVKEYLSTYKAVFQKNGLSNIFLITPQTPESRIRAIDEETDGFIYMVSSASTTGAKSDISNKQVEYFSRVNDMNLKNPRVIGFGISDKNTFDEACKYANGAIIGSAFVKAIDAEDPVAATKEFIASIKG